MSKCRRYPLDLKGRKSYIIWIHNVIESIQNDVENFNFLQNFRFWRNDVASFWVREHQYWGILMSEQFGYSLQGSIYFSALFLCSLEWKIFVRKCRLLQKAAIFWQGIYPISHCTAPSRLSVHCPISSLIVLPHLSLKYLDSLRLRLNSQSQRTHSTPRSTPQRQYTYGCRGRL